MRFKILIVGLLVGLMLIAGGALAQDTEETLCEASFLTDLYPDGKSLMSSIVEQVATLEATAAAGDVKLWLKQASQLRMGLGLVEAECTGKHFNSAGKGLKSLVGPLVLPDGLWKASLRTDGMITTATITNVNGECYDIIPNLFLVSSGTLDVAQEALMTTSGGCVAMIQIEQAGGTAWDLIIEPISLKAP